MEIFYNFLFYDVLVPIQCISVLWTLACHQLFVHRYVVRGCKIFTWQNQSTFLLSFTSHMHCNTPIFIRTEKMKY